MAWIRNTITGMLTHPYAGAIDIGEDGTFTPSITGEPCATEEEAMAAAEDAEGKARWDAKNAAYSARCNENAE